MRFRDWLAASAALWITLPAAAQQAPAEPDPEFEDEAIDGDEAEFDQEIVVTGARPRGSVEGNIDPEVTLGPRDVRAYGASNVAELIDALSPQTGTTRGRGGGRPVVLLNGRRISGFSEIRGLPPEAIERVEILPEEVALNYGYRADQRVVNIVLRRRFRALTAEVEHGLATAGGRSSQEVDLNYVRIGEAGRWSVDLEYERETALLESERDILGSPPSRPFDLLGNVAASPFAPDAEIDPALSAIAGETVTIAAVPPGGAPTLAGFAAGANAPNVTDTGRFRSLLPATEQLEASGTLNRTIFGDVGATLNARLGLTGSESRLGLPSVTLTVPEDSPFSPFGADVSLFRFVDGGALVRDSDGRTLHVGLGLDGREEPWRWTFTANWDHGRTVTRTDRGLDPASLQARLNVRDPAIDPFGALPATLLAPLEDRARTETGSADALLVANGPLAKLPAGDARLSLRAGLDTRGIESETRRGGAVTERDLSRHRAAAQASLDLPIASRRRDVLAAIGDLSANVNAEVEQLSDFGTLRTLGLGLRWSPIEPIDIAFNLTDEDGAPTMQQLGDPVLLTPNVRLFDFVRGETVDIARLEGGNPVLLADHRREIAIRVSARPFDDKDLSIVADYTHSRTDDPIAAFPTATAEIEAAFPERFTRDAEGRLVQIDARPINFARAEREELRWGINFSQPIGPQGPTPEQRARRRERRAQDGGEGATPGAQGGERRGGGGGRGFRGFGGRGFGGPGGGRLQLSLHHRWRFEDSVLIRPGVPELDFLGGSAAGSRGGRPAHEIEFRAGLYRNGLGARLDGEWQSGTFVRGADGVGDLFFSDHATFDLRLFADLSQQRELVRRHRWLRGTRVSFSVDNLFDTRPNVRNAFGETPLGFQPDLLDPLGRTVRVSIRKLFF